jgi:hypothetical protein
MKEIKKLYVIDAIAKGYHTLIAIDEDDQEYTVQCAPYEELYLMKVPRGKEAEDYLKSQGIDPEKLVEEGIKKINEGRKVTSNKQ